MSEPALEVAMGRWNKWSFSLGDVDLADQPPAWENVANYESPRFWDSTPSLQLILCITTWVQCFSIYTSVLATKHPLHVPELIFYMIRASKQFNWPIWMVYDTNYHQHMADIGCKERSKVDSSIYSRCSTGWVTPPRGASGVFLWTMVAVRASSRTRGKERCPQPYPSPWSMVQDATTSSATMPPLKVNLEHLASTGTFGPSVISPIQEANVQSSLVGIYNNFDINLG